MATWSRSQRARCRRYLQSWPSCSRRQNSMDTVTLRVFRGDARGGAERDYEVPTFPGMVVLDAIHYIQAHYDSTLSCRWNCKAGKCGSCSAEICGRPRPLCKARVRDFATNGGAGVGPPPKTLPLRQ